MAQASEKTGVHKVIHKATSRDSAPAWIVYVVAYNFIKTEILYLTDGAERAAFLSNIPDAVTWVANNGATIMAAVGVGVGVWQYILKQRQHNERAGDAA